MLTQGLNVKFLFGGTALLIVVGVAMDTVQQIESQLIMRHYEGFPEGHADPRQARIGEDPGNKAKVSAILRVTRR